MSIDRAIARLQALKRNVRKIAANELVNYALDNIKRQRDINGMPLRKRKPGSPRDAGRAILVDTGDGRRSIQASVTATGAQLTANEYMVAHNEGATVRGTFRVRQHTRRRGGRAQTVKAHSRTVNFTLPQRAFAGKSREQINRIEKAIANQIIKALT